MDGNLLLILAQKVIQRGQQEGRIIKAPWADAAISAIMSGDAQTGQKIASNLAQSYGMTVEQAAQDVLNNITLPL